jgi:GxxExxY protein
MTHLRHEKLTYELRGLVFEVRKKLKTGWSEEIYHQGLAQLLRDKGVPVQSKPRRSIIHRGITVQTFECDLIVWDLIILELKMLPFTTFVARHYAQLICYLKCWIKDLGLLVNFGPTRAQIERFVWDEPELKIHENYDSIKPDMTDTDRLHLRQVRQSILAIGQQHGLGYPETMYRKITAIEMNHNGLSCQSKVEIPARWDSRVLAQHSSDHLLVEDKYLLNVRSLLDQPPKYDFARTKTYLNSLGLKFGLIVNFGKKQLQIYGVNPD